MLSERDFLARQSADAKARLRQTARDLTAEVLEPLRIRPLVRRRPWWCLGGASAAGFLSGIHFGRRNAKSAPTRPRTWLQQALAPLALRARHLVRSTLGAVVMAKFREAGSPPAGTTGAPPRTNGHASTVAPGDVRAPQASPIQRSTATGPS